MSAEIDPDAIVARVDENSIPTETLTAHGQHVATRACWLAGLDDSVNTQESVVFDTVARLHDVGKAVPAFQAYIRGEPYAGQQKHTYHARLGAFAVAHTLAQTGAADKDILAGWAAVLRHHGALPDLVEETIRVIRAEWREQNNAWVTTQIEAIDEVDRSRSVFDSFLRDASDGTTGWDAFREAIASESVHKALLSALGLPARCPRKEWATEAEIPAQTYDRALRLWSSLTLADKTVASGSVEREHLTPESLSLSPLESYIDDALSDSDVGEEQIQQASSGIAQPDDETSLNALRESARRRVKDAAPELLDHEVGLLTLPTGLGKTFSGLTGAFTLRDEVQFQRDLETPPLVVYALPYTSIIEQTREVFETEVFDTDPTGRAFTTHHYLTETVTYTDDERGDEGSANKDQDESRAKLLGESWRSGVVLTTFVQLIESLAGPSNAAGLKLPALHDAVIILDEPQALPKPWWDAVRRLSRTLIDEFDARIVSMTATQPTLFTASDIDTMSLLSSSEDDAFERRAYDSVSRVQYRVDDSIATLTDSNTDNPVSHTEAAGRLIEAALPSEQMDDPASVLSVCSTVASSRTLTDRVTEQAPLFGVDTTHIGSEYEAALSELDTAGNNSTPESPPDAEAVAHATLSRLGFTENKDGEWECTDDWGDRLLVGTFNARYRPLDRRALIRIADIISTTGIPFVFVSTQAIEAGVDISFTNVFRDIAPLDSVVQTAGRCNRSFEWGVDGGTATVWCLDAADGEDSTLPAEYIYPESEHLNQIATLLWDAAMEADEELIPASTFERDVVPAYFEFVEDRSFLNDDLKLWIDECEADQLGHESLLGDEYETVDVLIAATDADTARINQLRELFAEYEGRGYERLRELSWMRVSVSVRTIEELQMHSRVDGSGRQSSSGVDVFGHPVGHGNGSYDLAGGGFFVTKTDVVNRFT
ncbi:CRISPR-associated endonuclease Cas3'' [Halobaculum gomorrense]|uniref:CRISPR-associated endonuclease/helicase Cas3/CRISPR-associated endonuclease Cas3-HD n=1 Tax=Halobaculum gomorrense TaxID=43928 RepID=A0A1M5URS0_9EURY|nr:CRISPR-associated endonuclease Cas3'' [Halobaculum gomorrense]SHH65772.1 CRISPR-associated endonuclease/helicase Cas3/CRISPR-associated endonuclease Cas3-HD [Halobaculum gomorrense]